MPRRKPIADRLRAEIAKAEKRGITRSQIARDSGVSQATLSLFVNDPDRSIRLDFAERIAEAIGLRFDLNGRK